ncbi:MAG: PD-(D/E)XK nuclease family protein [Pseudomonadales bacterium]|nr:PD-(D/E)XK nuclease family protein [Pseudomonadales bacterium]
MPDPVRLILTPTPRLARTTAHRWAMDTAGQGARAWLPPRILAFSAWLSELRTELMLGSDDDRVLISASQSRLLWQSLVDQQVFVGEPRVAELAQRAWRRIHEFDLPAPADWQTLLLSEDSQKFRDWARRFRTLCRRQGYIDEWALNAELASRIEAGAIRLPDEIELAGFDLPLTPLQSRILAGAQAAGCRLIRTDPAPSLPPGIPLHSHLEPDDELRAAARWCRAQLDIDPNHAIAVVVADLPERVTNVERVFREVFDPRGFRLAPSTPDAWHISLGLPLGDWPLVADALALLQLAANRLTQPQASRLLRSPYLPGWEVEATAREVALARLAKEAPYDLTFTELGWVLEGHGATALGQHLALWQHQRSRLPGRAWPSEWAAAFQQELSALGFCTGRGLDSREHQVLQRWHDLLETLATLDTIADAPLPRARILDLLEESADSAVFREQNTGVPVEILGVEEALGSRFDALWITTLDAQTWPGSPQRDPLIPAAFQVDVPRATPAGALAHARLELAALCRSAPRIEGSFSRGREEAERQPTALLPDALVIQAAPENLPQAARWSETLIDDPGIRLLLDAVGGGTSVLKAQSECPFRAFAQYRLGARDLSVPRPGLDAGQRGTVIHKALEIFWEGLADRAALAALAPEPRARRIREAVDAALENFTSRYRLILSAAARRLEARRTERALERWLADVELPRGDFAVLGHEIDIRLQFAGLSLTGKIDRIDRLPDGTTLLIDYKTGQASRGHWYPEPRLVDPQLPAYAVTLDPAPGAIAFARIRPEELRFEGLSATATGTAGIDPLASAKGRFRELADWQPLLTDWHSHLEALAGQFVAGAATVDPRDGSVCRHCHLHAFCRIAERAPAASYADETAADADIQMDADHSGPDS